MIQYPTQSHYHDTDQVPCPVLLMLLLLLLGSDKRTFCESLDLLGRGLNTETSACEHSQHSHRIGDLV